MGVKVSLASGAPGGGGLSAQTLKKGCDFYKGGEAHGNLVLQALKHVGRIKVKGAETGGKENDLLYFCA